MTELDQAISKAYASQGSQEDVNKVYLILLQSSIFLPIKKAGSSAENAEPFQPLYTVIEGNYFILAFDQRDRLFHWGQDQLEHMDYVEMKGRDLIIGINPEKVFLVINFGTEFAKEFSPEEIRHLKKIVSRLDQLKNP
ncbi:MAG TPA: SseB family protein [Gammaproteobacteria bacterium]|nr:SseB family protein [Gammaproteobacteria bacterium]